MHHRPLRIAATVLAVALAGLGIAACTLGEPDSPLGGESMPAPLEPPSEVPAVPPETQSSDPIAAAIGEPVEGGAWRLLVREARSAVPAEDGVGGVVPVVVEFELSNLGEAPLRVSPGDFTLRSGSTSVFPSETAGHGLASVTEVAAGASVSLTGRFEITAGAGGSPVTFVFAPAEGGPIRFETVVEQE